MCSVWWRKLLHKKKMKFIQVNWSPQKICRKACVRMADKFLSFAVGFSRPDLTLPDSFSIRLMCCSRNIVLHTSKLSTRLIVWKVVMRKFLATSSITTAAIVSNFREWHGVIKILVDSKRLTKYRWSWCHFTWKKILPSKTKPMIICQWCWSWNCKSHVYTCTCIALFGGRTV